MMVNPSDKLCIEHVGNGGQSCRTRSAPPRTQKDEHPEAGDEELHQSARMPRRPEIEKTVKLRAPVVVQRHGVGSLRRSAENEWIPSDVSILLEASRREDAVRDVLCHRVGHEVVFDRGYGNRPAPWREHFRQNIERRKDLTGNQPRGETDESNGSNQNAGRKPSDSPAPRRVFTGGPHF